MFKNVAKALAFFLICVNVGYSNVRRVQFGDVNIAEIKSDYLTEVIIGNVTGHTYISLSGENEEVGTTAEVIAPQGGRYPWLQSAVTLSILSTSADDTAAGTGARTIRINGLNANWVAITDEVTLSGTTTVNSNILFFRVNEALVLTAGSSNTMSGNVDIKNGSDILARIETGRNITRQGVFSVPADTTLVLTDFNISVGAGDEAETVLFATNETNNIQYYILDFYNYQNSPLFVGKVKFPEKRDIEFVANNTAGSGTARLSLFANFILRDN